MTAVAVVIEIAAPDRSSPHIAALLGACSHAVADGECTLSPHEAEPAGTLRSPGPVGTETATAIVVWDGAEHRGVRIEVGVPKAGRAEWMVRDLQFRAEDQEVERWRSVGLVIATLIGESRESPPPPPPPPPHAPPPLPRVQPPDRAQPPPRRAPDAPWLWVDGAAFTGPALDDGTWRFGALLRGAYAPSRIPLLAIASLRYAARPSDDAGVGVAWASGSIGLGGRLDLAGRSVVLDGRAELVAELVIASVRDPSTGATDSGGRWIGAGRAGLDAVWMAKRNLGLLVGIDAALGQSGTVVTLRDRSVARVPPFTIAPSIGVRVALP